MILIYSLDLHSRAATDDRNLAPHLHLSWSDILPYIIKLLETDSINNIEYFVICNKFKKKGF